MEWISWILNRRLNIHNITIESKVTKHTRLSIPGNINVTGLNDDLVSQNQVSGCKYCKCPLTPSAHVNIASCSLSLHSKH